MEKEKKIIKNLIFGFLAEVVAIVLGIIVPRLTLTNYGSEINGLVSTVGQVYAYVALLEAGIGATTVQALYKPVGEGDRNNINAILSATNRYYKRTGIIYAAIVLAFSAIYPFVLDTTIPKVTIALIVLCNGVGQVISYFCQAKYFLLLQAEGKNYIQTNLNMITNIVKNIAKIGLMAIGVSVVIVQAISVFVSLIQMVYMTLYIKRCYRWINLSVEPNKQALVQNKNVLIHQVSWLIVNNTDTIVLTFFCGLKTVSVYAIYTLLFGMINTVCAMVGDSLKFDLGQSYGADKKRFYGLFNLYEVVFITLVFILFTITNYFMTPFLSLYTSGVTDIVYIDKYLPLMFSTMYILMQIRKPAHDALKVAGHFKSTQWQAVIEAAINIVVSVATVPFLGIYGVIVGTIVALLYRTNALIIYSNKRIVECGNWRTYRRILINIIVFCVVLCINPLIVFSMDSYLKIALWCIVYAIGVAVLYIGIISVFEIKTIKDAVLMLRNRKSAKMDNKEEEVDESNCGNEE